MTGDRGEKKKQNRKNAISCVRTPWKQRSSARRGNYFFFFLGLCYREHMHLASILGLVLCELSRQKNCPSRNTHTCVIDSSERRSLNVDHFTLKQEFINLKKCFLQNSSNLSVTPYGLKVCNIHNNVYSGVFRSQQNRKSVPSSSVLTNK